MSSRTEGRDASTTWDTRLAQYDAVCAWGSPNHALLQRLNTVEVPVFIANGDSDPMVLPHYSYLLAGLIPHSRLKSILIRLTGSYGNITTNSPPMS